MLDKAFFVSPDVQEKIVSLPNGEKHTLYFKEITGIKFRKFFLSSQSENEDIKDYAIANLIAMGLCNSDGTPALTAEQASELNASGMNAIFMALLDVNGQGEQKKD